MKWLVTLNAIPLKKKMRLIFSFRWFRWKQRSFKKYEEVWEGIKKEIETINGGEKIEYGKDF